MREGFFDLRQATDNIFKNGLTLVIFLVKMENIQDPAFLVTTTLC